MSSSLARAVPAHSAARMVGHNTRLRRTTTPTRALLRYDFDTPFLLSSPISYRLPSTLSAIARQFTAAVLPAATGRAPILATAQSVKLVATRRF